jgi:predicted metal-dependent phosphoesterase TrpH
MLIDFHAHSALSRCCKIDGKDALLVAIENGMDGFILTNHYDRCYLINDDKSEYATRYINEYYYVKEWADKLGVKAYFGVEITMAKHDNVHILLYGINPEFLLEYPDLYDYELKDLSELAHKYNSILIQAHPFRNNCNVLQDLNYLDGIEANCHTIKEGPHLELVSNIAKEYKKILTCGGDFHNDASRAKCGVYLPEDLNNIMGIVNYLKQENEIKLCVQLGKSQETVIDYIFSKI